MVIRTVSYADSNFFIFNSIKKIVVLNIVSCPFLKSPQTILNKLSTIVSNTLLNIV